MIDLPPSLLVQLPGDQSEHEHISEPWVNCLADKIIRDGWLPDSLLSVFVYPSGRVTLGDGNHRARAALRLELLSVPCSIRQIA